MRIKKWTSLILLVVFFVSFGNSNIAKAEPFQIATGTYVNPMYENKAEIPTESLTTVTRLSATSGVDAQSFTTIENASNYMREELVKRSNTISFTVNKAYYPSIHEDIFNLAIAERDENTSSEGDYIYSHFDGYNCSIAYTPTYTILTYEISYISTYEEEQAVDEAVKNVLDSLNVYDSDEYTKIKAVHDYIVQNIKYDYSLSKYSAYNAIIEKNVVCQGFASLTYKMLKELGVGVRVITGLGNGVSHGWNMAEISGQWYNIDNTWDEYWYSEYNITSYKFFLKNSTDFTDHTRDVEYNTISFNKTYLMDTDSYVYYPRVVKLVDGIEWSYQVNDIGNAINVMPVQNIGIVDKFEILSSITIPDTLDNKKVISIGYNAFSGCTNLTSINLPDGITKIGINAFLGCTSLRSISIPSSVIDIKSSSFVSCANLTTIYADSGSNASSYAWTYGKVDTVTGYTKGALIIDLLRYDTNSDSEVNIIDLANIAKKFNSKRTDINWEEKYDYYGDGIIDIYDLVKISKKIS